MIHAYTKYRDKAHTDKSQLMYTNIYVFMYIGIRFTYIRIANNR